MATPISTTPVPYAASIEHFEDGEADTTAELIETMRHIAEITYKDGGHGLRSVHAKSHGLVRGELRVVDGLPPAYAQGLFAQPGHYPVIMRMSTSPGDVIDDNISTPRGCAMKILGVPGARVAGSEAASTQDFVMANGPAFTAPTAKKFAGNAKLLASTTDKAEGLKKAFSAVLRGTEKLLEAVGGQSPTLKSLGGHPETNLLGETFHTQVPVLYGAYMAKLSLRPLSPSLKALKDSPLDLKDRPTGIRESVSDYFASNTAEWELCVQLCTDLDKMPIEDASVIWPEDLSPFVTVGYVTAPSQATWPATATAMEDRLSFNPWHALAAHRPLGSVMRVRKSVYEASLAFRTSHNGIVPKEPESMQEVLG